MIYPAFVEHASDSHAFGLRFPDIPGCFSAADNLRDLVANAREAIAAHHLIGERLPIPAPFVDHVNDPEYRDGFWIVVDTGPARRRGNARRLNISMPTTLVRRIDKAAKAHRLSRSAFLAIAAEHEMEKA